MHPAGEFFKIRTVITGHGQQGEFIGRVERRNTSSVDKSIQIEKVDYYL